MLNTYQLRALETLILESNAAAHAQHPIQKLEFRNVPHPDSKCFPGHPAHPTLEMFYEPTLTNLRTKKVNPLLLEPQQKICQLDVGCVSETPTLYAKLDGKIYGPCHTIRVSKLVSPLTEEQLRFPVCTFSPMPGCASSRTTAAPPS